MTSASYTGDVLVVIPCLNEERYLDGLVRQIAASPCPRPMRIVIADGGSTDRTPQLARVLAAEFPHVTVMPNPKRLQSAAVNLAAAVYGDGAEYLIRIDAHCGYPADYCQALVAEAETTGADCVVVGMDTVGHGGFQSAVAAAQNSRLGNGGAAHRHAGELGQWVDHGHHALMRVDAFQAVGGYDESFSHNEDAELDTRLVEAGFRIWLTRKAVPEYYPRSAPLPLYRQYMNYGRGRVRTIMKHQAWPKPRQIAPAAVLPALILALATPLTWLAAAPLLVWALLCLGYGAAIGRKAGDMQLAWAGPAAMIMHLGWSVGFWRGMLKL